MIKCPNCDTEMIEGKLHGEPFTMELDHEVDDFSIRIKKDEKTTSFLGIPFPNTMDKKLYTLVCPKCGKVEFYVEPFNKE